MSRKRFSKFVPEDAAAPPKPFGHGDGGFQPSGVLQSYLGSSTASSPLSTGASTPVTSTAASSTVSLTALTNALRDIDTSPLSEHFETIINARSLAEIRTASGAIVELLASAGPQYIEIYSVKNHISSLVKARGSPLIREGAMLVAMSIFRRFGVDMDPSEAYLLSLLTLPFDLLADKETAVKRAAQLCIDTVGSCYPDEAKVTVLWTRMLEYLTSSAKWQSKVAMLKFMDKIIAEVAADLLEPRFVDTIPVFTIIIHDMKPELAQAATKTLTEFAQRLDNLDVVPRVPVIVKTLLDPRNVQDCIKQFSAVTFVAEVTEAALAILVPILSRALNMSSTSQDSLRSTVIVVENLTRLVNNPIEAKPFIPELMPGIKRVISTAAQPEVRELASKAMAVLEQADKAESYSQKVDPKDVQLPQELANLSNTLASYTCELIACDVNSRDFKRLALVYQNYLGLSEDAANTNVEFFRSKYAEAVTEDNGEEGIEVVNTQFSLAYGTRMLLNKTFLRLFKGHRYGLCGRNGAGKSTLMRSIASGKLEGFPDKDQVRTCFVEHKLQGSDADMDIVSFIHSDPELDHLPRDDVSKALEHVGFDEYRRAQKVGALSGGWKMKLELARAVLMKADILLLDEPTNHLDVANVKWLQEYLVANTEITSLIVSHDSRFLDAVCTDIIHYENKKLAYYKGNLAEFVKVKPEGKAYYTLTDSNLKMAFPPPGILTGVRSNTRAIARISHVTFTYPGTAEPSLVDVSCTLSLSSRVAVIGANGAGKSTLIKLLTGELVPDVGTVEKHPNLRIGYIAQHALQHVELHKEKTANQYLQWRYQNGDDREVHLKQTRKMSDKEKEIMAQPIELQDGRGPRILEALIGRQKLKKSFQYEVKWKNLDAKYNSQLTREFLLEHGFDKLVQAFDDHEASREGLGYRELSPPVIRKHFEDVGLDGDIADHTPMGSLSGGQLVKVVIAGAMWNNPHLLVLDEPTNYLDRDSLGGLAVAIREWTGGVVMISHNEEFVGALCPEQWHVGGGQVIKKGITEVDSSRFEDNGDASGTSSPTGDSSKSSKAKAKDDDSPANIKVRRKKKLTRNELKEREVRRRLRYIEWLSSPKGTPKPVDSDDD